MMNRFRWLCFVLLCLFALPVVAQPGEVLSPLESNPYHQNRGFIPAHKQLRNATGTFIYLVDTFDISTQDFVDDFSSDLFKHYDAQPGDPDVTDTTYHLLWIGGNIAPFDTALHNDTTWVFTIDTVQGDTVITNQVMQASTTVEVWDICNYPPTNATVQAWPAYNIYDTVWLSVTDSVDLNNPAYPQDSAVFYIVDPDSTLWLDSYVWLNNSYPVDPPSIGVATFDGLNENGYPYDFTLPTTYGEADFLTSVPIDLSYVPADSVYLSFYFQAQGIGNDPQTKDSLALEFLSVTGDWEWQWSVTGEETEPFEKVNIVIDSTKYLYDGFQFRFRNYATLSGNLDHWHLDYVELGHGRSVSDPSFDVAYVYPFNGLLSTYTTMPWTHYKASPEVYMVDEFPFTLNNLTNNLHTIPHFLDVDFGGSNVYSVNSNTTASLAPLAQLTEVQWVDNINNFQFDTALADTCATFQVSLRYAPIGRSTNDIIEYEQVFWNQYAYDDGSAELAYGLQGSASKLAYLYNSAVADTLNAIYMFFSPVKIDVSAQSFNLMVWAADGPAGEPGTVLSENQFTFSRPVYGGTDKFTRYELETPVVVSGNYYVGWLQQTDVLLNVGFDQNTNTANRIRFNTQGTWQTSNLSGSLMIRPAYTTAKDYLLSTPEVDPFAELVIYPNPTAGMIHFNGLPQDAQVEVYDLQGRQLIAPSRLPAAQLDLQAYDAGTYLVRVTSADEMAVVTRLITLQ